MLNPASGGASVGVWGRYPSAISLRLTESVNSTLICVHLRLIFSKAERSSSCMRWIAPHPYLMFYAQQMIKFDFHMILIVIPPQLCCGWDKPHENSNLSRTRSHEMPRSSAAIGSFIYTSWAWIEKNGIGFTYFVAEWTYLLQRQKPNESCIREIRSCSLMRSRWRKPSAYSSFFCSAEQKQ